MAENSPIYRCAIIMAGGSGERFWPLSRRNRPKQLLKLTSPTQTMLDEAVERIAPLISPERVYVVTAEHLADAIRDAGTGIPDANVLAEPAKRNTAGCLLYATAHLLAHVEPDPAKLSVAVLTADHRIGNPARFRETVRLALEAAERSGGLITHGITPTRPDTGYGYVQADTGNGPYISEAGIEIFPVAAFHEKPSAEKAEDFIASGDYYWNSGMFFWRVDAFLGEFDRIRPEMSRAAREIAAAMRANDKGTASRIFESIEDISIDYALMEHTKKAYVARADYPWDDVGAWPSLDRTRERDAAGNVAHGDPVLIGCENCIVYNDAGAERVAVSVVGCEDLIVVVSEDGVLVVPKSRAQDVRHAVKELRARGSDKV